MIYELKDTVVAALEGDLNQEEELIEKGIAEIKVGTALEIQSFRKADTKTNHYCTSKIQQLVVTPCTVFGTVFDRGRDFHGIWSIELEGRTPAPVGCGGTKRPMARRGTRRVRSSQLSARTQAVFNGRDGKVAGAEVLEGQFTKGQRVHVIRKGKTLGSSSDG